MALGFGQLARLMMAQRRSHQLANPSRGPDGSTPRRTHGDPRPQFGRDSSLFSVHGAVGLILTPPSPGVGYCNRFLAPPAENDDLDCARVFL